MLWSNPICRDGAVAYIKYNVRVAIVEGSITVLSPSDDFELFYTPYLNTWSGSSICPGSFFVSCMLMDTFLKLQSGEAVQRNRANRLNGNSSTHIGAKKCNIRIFNVILRRSCQMSHGQR
jgi:hypothetical protein